MNMMPPIPTISTSSNDLDTRLLAIISELAEPREEIEKSFLEVGDSLGNSTRLLNDISSAYEAIPAALESEDFLSVAKILKDIQSRVTDLTTAHETEHHALEQLRVMTTAVASPLKELLKSIRMTKFIAINARIAATDLMGHNMDLGTFTTDVTKMTQDAEKAVSAFSAAYERLSSQLLEAHTVNTAFAHEHSNTMNLITGKLSEHQGIISHHQARANAIAEEQQTVTERIHARISTIILGLQIGDTTRQRVEHIEDAFKSIGTYSPAMTLNDPASHQDTFKAVCDLQSAQLDETISNFNMQVTELAQTLQQLTYDAEAVLQAGQEEAATLLSSGGAALGAIMNDLYEIQLLFRGHEKARVSIEKAALEVSDALSDMLVHTDAISTVEHQIRLLSLNTAIQCGQCGDKGGALKTIAHELRTLARQTMDATKAIMAELDNAETIIQRIDVGQASQTEWSARTINQQISTASQLLQSVIDHLHQANMTLVTVGSETLQQLEAASENISDQSGFSKSWQCALEQIAPLASLPPEETYESLIDSAFIAELRTRYTMDTERRLHDKIFGMAPHDSTTTTPTTPHSDTDVDDIFF